MWELPGPGIELVSPALAGGFLTTEPPRESLNKYFWTNELNIIYAKTWRSTSGVLASSFMNISFSNSFVCLFVLISETKWDKNFRTPKTESRPKRFIPSPFIFYQRLYYITVRCYPLCFSALRCWNFCSLLFLWAVYIPSKKKRQTKGEGGLTVKLHGHNQ